MLNDSGRDLATACGFVVAALIGAAFLIPGQIRQPGGAPGPPAAPGPGPTPQPEPGVVLSLTNEAPRYRWSLDQAIEAWNASGVSVRFRYTTSAEADIVVTLAPKSACGPDAVACTELGHPAGEHRTIWIVEPVNRFDGARMLVHELGHILGLTHDTRDGCVAMTPGLWQNCKLPAPGKWRCRLLARSDIERAIRLNGGTPQPASGPVFCPRDTGS